MTTNHSMTDTTGLVEWLVFDLGGVLVDVAPAAETMAKLSAQSHTPIETLGPLLREQFTEQPLSLAERFQLGFLDIATFSQALNTHLATPVPEAELTQAIQAILRGERRDTAALLEQLAGRFNTACYSNTNAVHWAYMQRHYGFFEHIEHRFASQEVGFAKPDARGFAAVATSLDACAAHCLLIDDRQINVDGARAAGWQALLFTGPDQLAADLSGLGIDVVPVGAP